VRDRVLTGGIEVKAGEGIGEGRQRDGHHIGKRIFICLFFFSVNGVVALLERPIPFSLLFSGAEIRSNWQGN